MIRERPEKIENTSHRYPFIALLQLVSRRTNDVVETSLFIIGFSMSILIGVQVFFRYALNHSIFWSEELGRILLVWITFLGASVAYKRKAHIGVDFLVLRLPERIAWVIELMSITLSLFFFSIMIVYGIRFATFIRFQKTPALEICKALPFSVIPLSGFILLLHGVTLLFESLFTRAQK